jgi:Autographiviridae endonuclease VII
MSSTTAQMKRYYKRYPEKLKAKNHKRASSRARRNAQLKALYGITIEQYEDMAKAQGGACALCQRPEHLCSYRKMHVDHDHETGVIRSLLCSQCNTMIGLSGESPGLLEKAAKYLLDARVKV